jgi:hypothetical protein
VEVQEGVKVKLVVNFFWDEAFAMDLAFEGLYVKLVQID